MAGVERDGDTAHWANDRFPTIAHIRNLVGAGCTVYSPLETFKYSNLGYAILGQVIATISGRSYEEYIEERIIRRLGLTHTSPTLTTAVRAKLAVGYGRDLPPKPRASFPSVEANAMTAAAGVTSNAVDLCHYMSAQFLGNSRLLSDESKREMQRIHWVNTKTDAHYGLGYDISKVGETRIVGHGGGFSGFITRIGMDPAQKIGIAVLTNALEDLAGELVNGIFSTIQYFTKRGARLQAPRTRSAGLARHEGTFSSRWYDAVVVNIGGRLVVFGTKSQKPMEEGFVLEHLHGHEFRISAGNEFGNLGEKAVFQFDRRGRVARLVWGPTPMKASHVG
jgi:CubicO group peptidase (beta-lactamase class C family)